ncbi:MAG: nicotinate-nucleotide diphosphorylase, partial [Owenweeksia sp.]
MFEFNSYLNDFIERAINEDIGPGDHSSNCSIPKDSSGKMHLLIKENGVIAGLEIAEKVFLKVDPSLKLNRLLKDGAFVQKGDVAFTIEGRERSMLQSERLALNILQRMSGIASQTARMVKLIEGT